MWGLGGGEADSGGEMEGSGGKEGSVGGNWRVSKICQEELGEQEGKQSLNGIGGV